MVKSIRTMVDKIPVTSKALQKERDTVAGQVADTMEGMAALAGDAKAMKTALAETADAVGDINYFIFGIYDVRRLLFPRFGRKNVNAPYVSVFPIPACPQIK